MSEIPWRIAIERALTIQGDAPPSRWVQLATVDPQGWPSVRTVVFRGFIDQGPMLRFTTDLRSGKAGHLARNSRVEACWVFPESREQFRLAGRMYVIGPDHPDPEWRSERDDAWRGLPPPTRPSFSWPDPGAPRSEPRRFRVPPPDPKLPPASFGLLVLDPMRVDHLDLRSDPHTRIRYHRPDADDPMGWKAAEVNP